MVIKMPAIYTHNVFAKNVFNKLDNNIQKTIEKDKNIYELFSQSFDFLYYYNFLSLRPGKKIRTFGRFCHRNKSQEYILNIIKYIKKNKLYKNSDILAYLYGSINHYTCDTTIHPYINYLAETSINKIGMHTKLEFEIDAYYYEKENNKPFYKYNLPKNLLPKIKFSNSLKKCITDIYKKTFNTDNIGNIYEKSYNQSNLIFKLGMLDRLGIKKVIYKILDIITIYFNFKISYCSFYIKNINTSFLNKEKKEWYNPYNKTLKSTLSWEELMESAQEKSINIITLCNLFFKNQTSLKVLKNNIPNKSYSNGLIIK